jgi:hypothetical protein
MEISRAMQGRPRGCRFCLYAGGSARRSRSVVMVSGSAGEEFVPLALCEVGERGESRIRSSGCFGEGMGSDWADAAVFLTAPRLLGGVIADHSFN